MWLTALSFIGKHWKWLAIAALAGLCWWLFLQVKKADLKAETAQYNVSELAREKGELATSLTLSKQQYNGLFRDYSLLADSILDSKKRKVKTHHHIVYKIDHDTIYKVIYKDPLRLTNDWTLTYNHNCLTSDIHYNDTAGIAEIKTKGEIPIDIVGFIEKNKGWFWKLQWGKGKWSDLQTKCSSPCGFKIKENIKFDVK